MTISKTQAIILRQLHDGWIINAPIENGMTNWITPSGRITNSACPIRSLEALRKLGLVYWTDQRWILTDAGDAIIAPFSGRAALAREAGR